MTMGIPA